MATKYYIAMVGEDGSTHKSNDYRGNFDTLNEAHAYFCNTAGTTGHFAWWDGAPPYCIESTDGSAEPLKLTRNERQRIRRRAPAQKAKEAAASRVSYWRKSFYDAPTLSGPEKDALVRLKQEQAALQSLRG